MRDDARLVAEAKAGDRAAFEAIVLQYQDRIGRYLYRLTSDWELARDLTQETFLRAYQHLGRQRDDAALYAWLYRIATNLAYDKLRRRRRLAWVPFGRAAEAHPEALVPDVADGQADHDLFRRALAALKAEHRACLLLHLGDGLSTEEVARTLGISHAAAKKRIVRAKAAFRTAYERLVGEVRG
ncbi:MAG TPA: sigma-70 family RNA polymerase sigma factor [Dehalococcoidia bacterium]